jgi:hypothetical protein
VTVDAENCFQVRKISRFQNENILGLQPLSEHAIFRQRKFVTLRQREFMIIAILEG